MAIQILGIERLQRNILNIRNKINGDLYIAGGRIGSVITGTAKSKARFKTGYMRDHIIPKVKKGKTVEVEVRSEADYSIYNEFGTSRMSAKPFMRPGLHDNLSKIQKIVADAVRRSA